LGSFSRGEVKRKKKREKGRIEGKEGERKEKRRRDEKRGMMGKKGKGEAKQEDSVDYSQTLREYSGTTSDNIL